MSILKKINYIFSARQKLQSILLCIGLFIGALFELAGVSLITQLVSIVTDPSKIHSNALLAGVYDAFDMKDERQFFLTLVIGLIIVYLVKIRSTFS